MGISQISATVQLHVRGASRPVHLLPDELPLQPPPHHGDGNYVAGDDEDTVLTNIDGYVAVAGEGS
eukprot:3047623-Pyramimonas_sp.AAC.1